MAITTLKSTQNTSQTANPPVMLDTADLYGRIRIAEFNTTQVGAGDATSSFALYKFPPGRVKLLLQLSQAYFNWTTASATADLGWDAYTDENGVAVAADVDGLMDGLDVDTVGYRVFGQDLTATGGSHEIRSRDGFTLRLSSTDVAIVAADVCHGQILFVVD